MKRYSAKLVRLTAGLLFAASVPLAHSAPVHLTCDESSTEWERLFVPATIVFDEHKKTIEVHLSKKYDKIAHQWFDGRTIGPVTARFSPEEITFKSKSGGECYSLNRFTGRFLMFSGCGSTSMGTPDLTCSQQQRRF